MFSSHNNVMNFRIQRELENSIIFFSLQYLLNIDINVVQISIMRMDNNYCKNITYHKLRPFRQGAHVLQCPLNKSGLNHAHSYKVIPRSPISINRIQTWQPNESSFLGKYKHQPVDTMLCSVTSHQLSWSFCDLWVDRVAMADLLLYQLQAMHCRWMGCEL